MESGGCDAAWDLDRMSESPTSRAPGHACATWALFLAFLSFVFTGCASSFGVGLIAGSVCNAVAVGLAAWVLARKRPGKWTAISALIITLLADILAFVILDCVRRFGMPLPP
jgi:hypothetical protein